MSHMCDGCTYRKDLTVVIDEREVDVSWECINPESSHFGQQFYPEDDYECKVCPHKVMRWRKGVPVSLSTEAYILVYDKSKFIEIVNNFLNEVAQTKQIDITELRNHILGFTENNEYSYSLNNTVLRYVEYGTPTFENHDWLWRAFKWHLKDNHLVNELMPHLEVRLEKAIIKEIFVWSKP